jgi:Txe/YoeB family toxin of Txe-Axe toxin-antitoxin module
MKAKIKFADEKIKEAFEKAEGKLKKHLKRAVKDIEENAFCGIQISKKLVPKEYISKYSVKNIWKYDLPLGWRLIYSVDSEEEVKVLAIVLEWFDHKNYEKKFGYRVREKLFSYLRKN